MAERALLRKYADHERPDAQCYDCLLPYNGAGFHDLLIPNWAWSKINPTHHEGAGLLCPTCIVRRCEAAGLENVPAWFASGPLRSASEAEATADFPHRIG